MNTARDIFNFAFSFKREPRSPAYRLGVLMALEYKAGEKGYPINLTPYLIGTEEHDAWLSGLDEGYQQWDKHRAAQSHTSATTGVDTSTDNCMVQAARRVA